MIGNKLSKIEIKLLEKTREFVNDLNENNPEKNKQYRKAYFIRMNENPKRNRMKIKIMQHHLLKNALITSAIYWNNAERGDIRFFQNYLKKEYSITKEKYQEFLLKEIPELKERVK